MITADLWNSISWINPTLGLSSHIPAQDARQVRGSGIQTVVSIGERRAAEGAGWEVVQLEDIQGDALDHDQIDRAVAAIGDAVKRGRTLVHCTAGISRSAGLVTLHVALTEGIGWNDALALVQKRRPVVQIDEEMARVMRDWLDERRGSF